MKCHAVTILLALLLVPACDLGDVEPEVGALATAAPCNGHADLCDRSLADVAFAGTHNSFALKANFTLGFFNQNLTIARQLDDGIRALMLDTYWHKPWFKPARATLCHGNCSLGGWLDLVPELGRVRSFLAAHPREVVLLLIEQHSLTPTQFGDAMRAAQLDRAAYVHPSPSAPWPTLAQLIDAGTRVVVFYWTDDTDGATRPAYYHRLRDEMVENEYKATSVAAFACAPVRGAAGAQLYLVNHFLSQPAGREDLARLANPWPVVRDHVTACEQEQLPNVVVVDFYDQDGEPATAVRSVVRAAAYLNGVPVAD